MNKILLYKYTCNNCQHVKYGSCGANKSRCDKCNSLSFGLFKDEMMFVTKAKYKELSKNHVMDEGIFSKLQTTTIKEWNI